MRIAILAHARQPIAQPFAGGMEAHCWHLAEGLSARGHEVVLFASADSDSRFAIDPLLPQHYEARYPWADYRGSPVLTAYLDTAYADACDRIVAGGFDVVHNNSLHRFPLEPRRTRATPTVTSLHVPPYDAIHHFVRVSVAPGHRLTVTSARQREAWWPEGAPAGISVLHNGLDPDRWPFAPTGNGEAVWCGRITPNKGPHLAARAALQAQVPLTLYGPMEDEIYFADEVAPLLGPMITYAGHCEADALAAALGKASVFLFTPCWDEPFGLVAAEAMACGLPVAAFDCGAAREVVGEAGAFAAPGDVAGLASAIRTALAIPPAVPRRRMLDHFTQARFLDRCEALYREVIAEHGKAAAAREPAYA